MKFNCLTCDKKTFDNRIYFSLIGTLEGPEVDNGKQVVKFSSNSSAVPGGDYEVLVYATKDMKNLNLKLGNQIFKK